MAQQDLLLQRGRFNRINPNRTIPTMRSYDVTLTCEKFQSYQSKQNNPDLLHVWLSLECQLSEKFQSYQSKQNNPD